MFWFFLHYILLDLSLISKLETPKKGWKGEQNWSKNCTFSYSPLTTPYSSVGKLATTSNNVRPNHSWSTNSASCASCKVTCAIQGSMLVIRAVIFMHAWITIERHLLCVNTTITTTPAPSLRTPQVTLKRCWKKCRNKFRLSCKRNQMLYIKHLRLRLNVQTDSIHAKVFVQLYFI